MTSTKFYDLLAEDYHLIYLDWEASIIGQAEVLDAVIRAEAGPGRLQILDCACGIGTQTLGLARLGHHLTASDLSPNAVHRASREAQLAGLAEIRFEVTGFLNLAESIERTFQVIIACDNSLPHLTSNEDMRTAFINFKACLEPGGILLATIRDYDQILEKRPSGTLPREMATDGRRRIVFQKWDWLDEVTYRLELFLLQEKPDGWDVKSVETTYRAWKRDEIDELLIETGFLEVKWRFPDESGYYQPILTALTPY